MARIRFTLTLLFLAGTLGIVAAFIPQAFRRVREAQRDVALAENRLTRQQDIVKAFEAIGETIAQNVDKQRLNEALPSQAGEESDVPDIITIMERLAEQEAAGIFLQGGDIADPRSLIAQFSSKGPRPGEVLARDIRIQGIGSYESISRFLDVVRSSLRILEPVTLQFTADPEGDIVPFQIALRTFLHVPCAGVGQCEIDFPATGSAGQGVTGSTDGENL